ncbi:disulfide bond formation protein B [Sulfitobacter guttiformis]|uniref:Disulfide bond formation protein DsbB n=1 Tax=Sulfitobacter guttiformis TaxID=74349 RepID=A0A420DID5_9RHOB|nr:disulfide bond formation protein B [Sulfitobacter guttiformis]KIN72241.1 Disulfide bond formation protein, DsbB family [Sulfitobacter guttiformis KCTC 32187]RKE93989.1 disulfide bond formation protein DsbB [Sulfitobacter guttiformis]
MRLVLLATLGSAAVLLGAYGFQHIGGMAPCKLCLWQRWPHGGAILIGLAILFTGERRLAWMGAIAALSTAAIGAYHVGVEQGWWEGPSTCTAGGVTNLSAQELMNQILAAPLVRCDDIAWQMAGISMAGWNAILSLGLAMIWIQAMRRA